MIKKEKDFALRSLFFCGATRSVFDPNNRLQTPSIGIKNDLKT